MERMTAFLIYLCLNQVSCALTHVFVKKGDDVVLNVTETDVPEDFSLLTWRFSTDDVLVSFDSGPQPKIRDKYAGRVEPDVNKFSVKLKNLQKSDSGVYAARLIAAREKIVAEYNVTVQVSCAVTPVFVKKGDDVLLNVTETDVPEEFIALMWKFSTNVLVSFVPGQDPTIRAKYAGRVEPEENKYSVKLKNLQKSDSGVYTARLTVDQDNTLAAYNITVQDPVSPVRLMVDSVSSRSDSCNLTVTCSAVDSDFSHIFRCDNKACYQEGGEITKSDTSFQVYPQDESIICNHSNHVSWTKHMIKIQDHCIQHGENRNHYILIWIGVALATFLLITAVLIYLRRRRTYHREKIENTIYTVPELETIQTNGESSAHDEPGPSPTTTYSTVGFHNRKDSTETKRNPQPETVYAQVQKPSKT
ncbi:uncharacterized protein LOC121644291 [Melanotaenia boesemani]|uniref:uncharacterized protein LOC121644291 n=1 Tax=Melanotaenia boesemani TaxID=1250792 RepID=UPI001C040D8B|nr:uncharacterized protein LOC121644291 [Melanotaenia boesemani]